LLNIAQTKKLDKSVMKQKKIQRQHGTDDDADKTLQHCSKISGDMNTVASSVCTSTGSYDTTEDLTDTDTSSQDKNARRKSNNKKASKKTSSIGNRNFGCRVQFVMEAGTLREVESHVNFSSRERSEYWWSDREKDRMMAKHERLVAKYEQTRTATKPGTSKKSSVEKIGSYRGLESWTAAGSLKLDYTIEQCISAVMDEQDRQWNEYDDDADVIAKKSQAVTEDSARRARLNGLQDAQEALKVRGESWSKKGGSDEMSVGSAISTGTAAIAKKKKRSKLLARLDDSHNRKEAVLASFKKSSSRESKKEKKKKKKSSKKSLNENTSTSSSKSRKKKSKSKDVSVVVDQKSNSSFLKEDEVDTAEEDQTSSGTMKTSQSITATSEDPPDATVDDIVSTSATTVTPVSSKTVSSFCAGPSVPVSPLSTHVTSSHSTNKDEYPLLATLRRQQEQLRRNGSRDQDDIKLPIHQYRQQTVIEDDEEDSEDTSDLLQTLRRQQKKQALSWQNQQQDDDGGNNGAPSYSGAAVSKVSSFRVDHDRGGNIEPAKFSDPPGRRPRRLASRHVGAQNRAIPENSSYGDKKNRSRSRSHDRYEKKKKSGRSGLSSNTPPSSGDLQSTPDEDSHSFDEGSKKMSDNFALSPGSGMKGLKNLRDGAKTFFKKGSKK